MLKRCKNNKCLEIAEKNDIVCSRCDGELQCFEKWCPKCDTRVYDKVTSSGVICSPIFCTQCATKLEERTETGTKSIIYYLLSNSCLSQ